MENSLPAGCFRRLFYTSNSACTDCLNRLFDFLRRKYQCEAHISFPVRSEACAWGDDDAGFFHQFHAECHAVCAAAWDAGPYEHGSLAVWFFPADGGKSVTKGIAACLVLDALFLHAVKICLPVRQWQLSGWAGTYRNQSGCAAS